MPILPIDSGRYGSNEIRNIFEEERRLRYQLEFEAQVASSQGRLNLIPKNASNEISLIARSNKITINKIKELESISEHDTASIGTSNKPILLPFNKTLDTLRINQ